MALIATLTTIMVPVYFGLTDRARTAKASRDAIIRANDGGYIGLASGY